MIPTSSLFTYPLSIRAEKESISFPAKEHPIQISNFICPTRKNLLIFFLHSAASTGVTGKKKKKGNNLNAIHREYGQINYIRSINFFKNEVLYPIWNIREILSERHKWKKVCSATHLYVSVKKRSPTHIYFYTNKLFLSYHSRDELLPPSGESERLRKRQFQFIKLFVPLELCDGYLF